jgi:hypothetical protein
VSAEKLREAARLMKARAEAATQGPWGKGDPKANDGFWLTVGVWSGDPDNCHAECDRRQDAEHIASWDPAVALAVADWLDACALVTEVAPDRHKGLALAVARAYLGETP